MSKPFKMLGHELPGPNQRDPSPTKERGTYTPQTGSGHQYVDDPRKSSAGGGGVRQSFGQMQQDIFGDFLPEESFIRQGSHGALNPEGGHRVTGEAFTGHETGDVNAWMEKEKAKKSVDVEVTVNGQKV